MPAASKRPAPVRRRPRPTRARLPRTGHTDGPSAALDIAWRALNIARDVKGLAMARNGTVLKVNAQLARLLGCSPASLEGKRVFGDLIARPRPESLRKSTDPVDHRHGGRHRHQHPGRSDARAAQDRSRDRRGLRDPRPPPQAGGCAHAETPEHGLAAARRGAARTKPALRDGGHEPVPGRVRIRCRPPPGDLQRALPAHVRPLARPGPARHDLA